MNVIPDIRWIAENANRAAVDHTIDRHSNQTLHPMLREQRSVSVSDPQDRGGKLPPESREPQIVLSGELLNSVRRERATNVVFRYRTRSCFGA